MDVDWEDEEGDTKVNFARSAEALAKLRSFEPPSPRPIVRDAAPEAHRLLSRADPAHAPRAAAAPAVTPPMASPGQWPGHVSPGSPKPLPGAGPSDVLTSENQPAGPTSWIALEAYESIPISRRQRPGGGRRLAIVIGAATAAAVVLAIGAWTGLPEKLASVDLDRGVDRGASPPADAASVSSLIPGAGRSAGAAVIVPIPPAAAPPAPESAQFLPPLPAGDLPGNTFGSSTTGPALGSPAPGSSPPSVDRSRSQESHVAVEKSPPSHKAAGGNAAKREAHAAKERRSARSRHSRATLVAAPSPTRPTHATRSSGDPDDILPATTD